MEIFQSIDESVLLWVQNNIRRDWLNPLFIFITNLGTAGILWICISIYLCMDKKKRKIGITCGLALVLYLLIGNIIFKNIFHRPRPFVEIEGLKALGSLPRGYSFPSGHTGSSFSVSFILYTLIGGKKGRIAMILATLIGFSRIYIGVHYLSDVIFGAILGIGIGLLSIKIVNEIAFLKKDRSKKARKL